MAERNVNQIVRENLCTSCGACSAVCPSYAIYFKETTGGHYFPFITTNLCKNCGLCLSVCSGKHFSDDLWNRMPMDPFSGICLESYVGKAKNQKIYYSSQSGGIVSALTIEMIDNGLADAAVSVVMDWGIPPRPRACLAHCAEEVMDSQKSKYCPVPVLSVLKEILHSEKRVVFVGTPCQVHGLANIMDQLPEIRKNIILIIGLICERVMTYAALDYFIYSSGIGNKSELNIAFKDKACGGYPGNIHIQTKNGQNKILPSGVRLQIKDYFTPARCRICFDKMNIFSDITIGDPHEIAGVNRDMGESAIILRTPKGLSAFRSLQRGNAIEVRSLQYKEMLKGQHIDDKKREWASYVKAWKETEFQLPEYVKFVMDYTTCPVNKRKYAKSLKYSLKLDDSDFRRALLKQVHYSRKIDFCILIFSFPLRYLQKIIRKTFSRPKESQKTRTSTC